MATRGTGRTGAEPRKVLPLLLGNHVLILLGAYLLVSGYRGGLVTWLGFGAGLAAAGIAIEIAVIGWSVSLARAAAERAGTLDPRPATSRSVTERRTCPACGWSGGGSPGGLCPRCRRPTFARP